MPAVLALLALLTLGVAGLAALYAVSATVRRQFEAGQEAVARHLVPLVWDRGPNTPVTGPVLAEVADLAGRLHTMLPDISEAASASRFSTSYAAGAKHALDILDQAVTDATPPDLGPAPKAPMLIDVYRRIVKVDNVLLVTR